MVVVFIFFGECEKWGIDFRMGIRIIKYNYRLHGLHQDGEVSKK